MRFPQDHSKTFSVKKKKKCFTRIRSQLLLKGQTFIFNLLHLPVLQISTAVIISNSSLVVILCTSKRLLLMGMQHNESWLFKGSSTLFSMYHIIQAISNFSFSKAAVNYCKCQNFSCHGYFPPRLFEHINFLMEYFEHQGSDPFFELQCSNVKLPIQILKQIKHTK